MKESEASKLKERKNKKVNCMFSCKKKQQQQTYKCNERFSICDEHIDFSMTFISTLK